MELISCHLFQALDVQVPTCTNIILAINELEMDHMQVSDGGSGCGEGGSGEGGSSHQQYFLSFILYTICLVHHLGHKSLQNQQFYC